MSRIALTVALALAAAAASCSRTPAPVPVPGRGEVQVGIASWYGPEFQGRPTSSGEVFDQNDMTAAHRALPFGTNVLVTNLENERTAVVRINDRGPFVHGRIIDLSYAAARVLGVVGPGTATVRIEVLDRPAEPEVDAASHGVAVQVGAFAVQENAYALKNRLDKTYSGVTVTEFRTPSQVFYRVRIKASGREAAAAIALRLAGEGYPVILVDDERRDPASGLTGSGPGVPLC